MEHQINICTDCKKESLSLGLLDLCPLCTSNNYSSTGQTVDLPEASSGIEWRPILKETNAKELLDLIKSNNLQVNIKVRIYKEFWNNTFLILKEIRMGTDNRTPWILLKEENEDKLKWATLNVLKQKLNKSINIEEILERPLCELELKMLTNMLTKICHSDDIICPIQSQIYYPTSGCIINSFYKHHKMEEYNSCECDDTKQSDWNSILQENHELQTYNGYLSKYVCLVKERYNEGNLDSTPPIKVEVVTINNNKIINKE